MMKKCFLTMLAFVLCVAVSAQSADKLYSEGKALYDAKNYKAAVPKLKAAAEKGHKKAQYRLGRCYDKGHGVTQNDAQAFQWYSKSAAQEYAKAQYAVGKCYKDGKGVEKDRTKAVSWFSKAAKQDNADGQFALGKSYLKGKGIAADEKKAKSWITKAVNNPKGGADILAKIRKDVADGDEDAKRILKLIGK
ncbi:MAG: sel1 repeat family protein [Prevotella sp.]|nr:sel1 repeat family protein [Prevotella sp.]